MDKGGRRGGKKRRSGRGKRKGRRREGGGIFVKLGVSQLSKKEDPRDG